MVFRFSYVCDLLEALSENKPGRSGFRTNDYIVEKWFRSHEHRIRQDDFPTAAFLSTLLPEKRTDRVYFIQEKGLRGIIGRALGLGRSRLAELDQWNQPGSNRDLADCVEAILTVTVSSSREPSPVNTIVIKRDSNRKVYLAELCRPPGLRAQR